MAAPSTLPAELEQRLTLLLHRGRQLRTEGLAYPVDEIDQSVRSAVGRGEIEAAEISLRRGELLMERVQRDWSWLKGLLDRAEELRELARRAGVDLASLEARTGNPREKLRGSPLTEGALEKAATSASLSVAVLSESLPKYLVDEARQLGESLRAAQQRGEETEEPKEKFHRLLRSLREGDLKAATQRFIEFRTSVLQIPRAPVYAAVPSDEAEEILREARNLARRLNQMKGRVRDAGTAAQLAAKVRATLSEDRRYGTPEEEIEELWNEVDRLSRERARAEPDTPPVPKEGEAPATENAPAPPPRSPPFLGDGSAPAPVLFGLADHAPNAPGEPSRSSRALRAPRP